MTNGKAPDSGDLGVVDPIRPPEVMMALGRRLRVLPPYALGFLLAALVRIVLDIAAWASSPAPDPGAALVSLVLEALPHSLVLLVPFAVAWSVQANGATSGRVIGGSVAVGLSELARMAAALIFADDGSTGLASAALSLGAGFLLAGGLLWMAHGLEALLWIEPTPFARRAGLAVAATGVTVTILQVVTGLLLLVPAIPGPLSDDVDQTIFMTLATRLASGVMAQLAWAYLAWVLIRGRDDPDRSSSGTLAGAVAGWFAGAWFLALAGTLVIILPGVFASPLNLVPEPPAGGFIFALSIGVAACSAGAMAALAWALANGLGSETEADETEDLSLDSMLAEDVPVR